MVYSNRPLSEVLLELERKNLARFSYSKDKLNINKKVSANIKCSSVEQALKTLFRQNNIDFMILGNQWALKNSEQPVAVNITKSQNQIVQQPKSSTEKFKKDISSITSDGKPQVNAEQIKNSKNTFLEQTILQRFRKDINTKINSWKSRKQEGEVDIFKFSLFGNSAKKTNKTDVFSLSLGWGVHSSSDAIQLAVIGSAVRGDVNGVQLAGIFNGSGTDVKGVQISGFLNSTKGSTYGMQLSGAYNYSESLKGVQLGAGLNITREELSGLQISGFGNFAGDANKSVQIAGLFNFSNEKSMIQLAGLYNKSDEVNGIQISTAMNEASEVNGIQVAAVNRANVVNGLQFGLINFADSVKGVSMGLINIVRAGGYNKLESSFSESLNVLFSLKMGSKSLYHIYQGGFALKSGSWGLGWGLGSLIHLNKKWNLNFELVALHINEDKVWTNKLNLMGQLRSGFEYNIDKGFGIFFGPSFNMMLSKYVDMETGLIGSRVPMYSIYDKTQNGTNLQFWLGCQTGLRMTLW